MIFSLDVRRARKGDCLLLHFGTPQKPRLAMIDGGPANVYRPHLKTRLLEIKKARGLNQEPLPVDLVMISHVDDDHICGILDLTREMLAGNPPRLIRVASFWHNSFEDLVADKSPNAQAQFGTAATDPSLPDEFVGTEEYEVVHDTYLVLAGIAQGQRLRDDAIKLQWPRNPEFNGDVILAGKTKQPVAESLTFVVAGPMKPELEALRKDHAKWLAEQKKKKKEGAAALAAYADESVANLSSIVVLASFGNKTMLLTGDARGDKIIKGLETTGQLAPGKSLHVNVLKVPHHGSSNNLELGFFERVTADHYVFSGNGEHGNPERESLDWLFQARKDRPFTVHLTYPVEEIDLGRKADWEKEQAKEKVRNKKLLSEGKPVKKQPRENWSPARHGLAALLQKTSFRNDQKISIVDAKKPHVIDLLDPLGF